MKKEVRILSSLGITDLDISAIALMIKHQHYISKNGRSYVLDWKGKRLRVFADGMTIKIEEVAKSATLADVMPRSLRI